MAKCGFAGEDDDLELDAETRARLQPMIEVFLKQLPLYKRMQTSVAKVLEEARSHVPPNWPPGIGKVLDLAFVDRLPVVWVPPSLVLQEMIELPDLETRQACLIEHLDEVCGHALTVVDEITSSDLTFLAESLREAIELLMSGRFKGAQALAAILLDEMFQRRLKPQWESKAGLEIKMISSRRRDMKVKEVPYIGTLAAMYGVLDSYDLRKGDIVPYRFNRHASVHGHCKRQYTPTNAIVGVLYAISLARQMAEDPLIVRPDIIQL